ncbi:MAG TPA: hypothetical protein VMM38_01540 [Aridibacter sp.]|nr:hypothetical protein [Aridibacter sp.]
MNTETERLSRLVIEATGNCWHEIDDSRRGWACKNCGLSGDSSISRQVLSADYNDNPDLSQPENRGILIAKAEQILGTAVKLTHFADGILRKVCRPPYTSIPDDVTEVEVARAIFVPGIEILREVGRVIEMEKENAKS